MERIIQKQKNAALQNSVLSHEKPFRLNLGGLAALFARDKLLMLLPSSAGFFIGRFLILQHFNPLAIAYLCVSQAFAPTLVFTAIGLYTRLGGAPLYKYYLCMALMCLARIIFKRLGVVNRANIPALTAAAALFVSGIASNIYIGFDSFVFCISILEAGLVFSLAAVMKRASAALFTYKRDKVYSTEEFIGLALLFGAVVAGSENIFIISMPFKYMICMVILLMFCNKGGASVGTAAGLVLGLLLFVNDPVVAVMFALGGLVSGLYCGRIPHREALRRKLSAIVGFMMGFGVALVLFKPMFRDMQLLMSLAFGSGLFAAIPSGFSFNLPVALANSIDNTGNHAEFYRNYARDRLNSVTSAFESLTDALSKLGRKSGEAGEFKGVLVEQLGGVGEILEHVKDELDLRDNKEFELAIAKEANKQGISVSNTVALGGAANAVIVSVDINERFSALCNHSGYNMMGAKRPSLFKLGLNAGNMKIAALMEIIGTVTGSAVRLDEIEQASAKSSRLRFVNEPRYTIFFGSARHTKTDSESSGDNFSFVSHGGRALLALADGMGSGGRANRESAVAVELLERLFATGFGIDKSVRLINSVLLMNSRSDACMGLDMAAIDLFDGFVEFTKLGAACGYLVRGRNVELIKTPSMPIGILAKPDIEAIRMELEHGDMIVMVTDGVADCGADSDWIAAALVANEKGMPQQVAEDILGQAKRQTGGLVRDDMTVIAAVVMKNGG